MFRVTEPSLYAHAVHSSFSQWASNSPDTFHIFRIIGWRASNRCLETNTWSMRGNPEELHR